MPSKEKEIARAISKLYGDKSIFTKRDFMIIYTAIFGECPAEDEANFLFQNKTERVMDLKGLMKFLACKMRYVHDTELHILEMFRALDQNTKCYVTLEDVNFAWRNTKTPFSAKLLAECFNLVSGDNLLDYFTFRKIYLKYN